jgi:hypothetical protein
MPRLLGKPSKAPVYLGVTLLVAIAGATALEYYGTIDLIPGFGQYQNNTKQLETGSGRYSTP